MRQKIKDYARNMAVADLKQLMDDARTDKKDALASKYSALVKEASKNYKAMKKAAPAVWTAREVLGGVRARTRVPALASPPGRSLKRGLPGPPGRADGGCRGTEPGPQSCHAQADAAMADHGAGRSGIAPHERRHFAGLAGFTDCCAETAIEGESHVETRTQIHAV